MNKLVDQDGTIKFNVYDQIIDHVNYRDYPLKTPLGKKISALRKKFKFNQFNFIGISGPELMLGVAVVDLKYLCNGFVYVYEISSQKLIEEKILSLPKSSIYIKPEPEMIDSQFHSGKLKINIQNQAIEVQGKDIAINVKYSTDKTNPLRICTRTGYSGWTYTQKTSPIQVSGMVRYKGIERKISSPAYLGFLDWTGGFMRRNTYWSWAAIASTLPDKRTFGLNLACGVNETGFTENAFWIDGKMTKVDMVDFVYNAELPEKEWRIISNDARVNLSFYPKSKRAENINAFFIASRFSQFMGIFEGVVKTADNEEIMLNNCYGWAEDHYAKW